MTRLERMLAVTLVVGAVIGAWAAAAEIPPPNPTNKPDGYTNTPMSPGTKWHIHDPNRPQPKWVQPQYDGKPVPPPKDATVLFDGDDLDHWKNKQWKLEDGAMVCTKGQQESAAQFGDVQLHVEFLIPKGITKKGQGAGNSGVFLLGRYEIQVLDCYSSRTYADGMCGAVYAQSPPLANASKPPGTWQSYDIHFKAPVFEGGKLAQPGYITVLHNNVLVQDNWEIKGLTQWKRVPQYKPHGPKGPIRLQAHGAPIRYRNLWVRPLEMKLGPGAAKK